MAVPISPGAAGPERDWDAYVQSALLQVAIAEGAVQELVSSARSFMSADAPEEAAGAVCAMLKQQQDALFEARGALMLDIDEAVGSAAVELADLPPRLNALEVTVASELDRLKAP
uniref:Uncharacterized protein n=1 Tax=Pyrodinium bahamense TaxID=73915 RepID=A0A7S0FLI2_9DINO